MRLKEGQGSSSSYILAWSRDLWLAFVGTVIVITIFMWGISSFRRFCEIDKCDKSNGHGLKLPLKNERTNQLSFSSCLLFVLGSVTQRGFGLRESPTATSLHVVAVLSLLFGLLMQTSYSAALVSRLAVLKNEQGVEKLADISARKSHSLCIRVENFAYSALFLGKDGDLSPEWKRIVNAPPCVPMPITDQDIRETICSKDAITLESTTVMARIMREPIPCFMTKLKGRYAVFYVPLLMKKGFPYKHLINNHLLRLHTSGVIQRLVRVWVHRILDLPVPLNELGVTMNHVNKILWLYALAIIISVMLLSLEIIHYKIHQEEDEEEG
ncbi:hypothetical protein LSTR_LSTR012515 [Laodelphax striatellus]|uniref:Ionotropic glutamate receptor C-terminal domain-containing protein n=1 Tax=Laodelphax striatellus TaxID=195883 RepID=A0A482XLL7_LAOST|nr:hypothetical protein LSTR_LSTR012515 [Laodelphax striatellus]